MIERRGFVDLVVSKQLRCVATVSSPYDAMEILMLVDGSPLPATRTPRETIKSNDGSVNLDWATRRMTDHTLQGQLRADNAAEYLRLSLLSFVWFSALSEVITIVLCVPLLP